MVEYTIDDIRGPTVAREMAQLKEFVLAQFNGAIADAEAAAAAAATAAANAVLANTVKKTGEASQSIAGNVGVTGTIDAAAIGSGSTPITCGNLTAYGSVSLDDTVLQGNLSGADSSALINLSGVGSVLVPDSTLGNYVSKNAVNAPRMKNELDNYSPMVRDTGNKTIAGNKNFTNLIASGLWDNKNVANVENSSSWRRVYYNDTGATNQMLAVLVTPQKPPQGTAEYGILMIGNNTAKWILKGSDIIVANFIVTLDSDGVLSLWVKNYSGNRGLAFIKLNETNWGNVISNWKVDHTTVDPSFDPTTYVSHVVSS